MLPLRPDMASLSVGSNNFPTRVYENPPDLVDWLAAEMLVRDPSRFSRVVLAGPGDDILGGQTAPGADGVTPLIPWLVGGPDNDRYFITPGSMAVVSDLAGGRKDIVSLDSFAFKKVQIRNIDRRHALISRGATSVLVVDPAGKISKANTTTPEIENRRRRDRATGSTVREP